MGIYLRFGIWNLTAGNPKFYGILRYSRGYEEITMASGIDQDEGIEVLLMGNEAIARGALEAGIQVAAAYPGTPSSEVVETLSKVAERRGLYVEWSANEKVAMEVAAAASFAGLRSLCVMKQNGVNVASDFLLHLVGSGVRGGMVLLTCDDPGALSSVNEGESRHFARMVEIPLLEPADFQEAKDIIPWAFALSEEIRSLVMVRSVTRMSHASGNVVLGHLPEEKRRAFFASDGHILDPDRGPMFSTPVIRKHLLQQEKIKRAREIFEKCALNCYEGPEHPELLIITSSACTLYSREAIHLLRLKDRVGLLKLGTTWPIPPELVTRHLASAEKVLIVEEVISFLEDHVKILASEKTDRIGKTQFYGKNDGTLPMVGELNPDLVAMALGRIFDIPYEGMTAAYEEEVQALAANRIPSREQTFCPGCPHRASFWVIQQALALDGRQGFVCGDIGCYSLAAISPANGYNTMKTIHSMGSGAGLASGFGKLRPFGMDQPVLAVCGDSTFYHAAIPAVINAVHHRANMILVVLDNGGTAMTGFQSHPGLYVNAMNEAAPAVNLEDLCQALGARVVVRDPFDLEGARKALNELIKNETGVRVLIMRQVCALSPQKRGKRLFAVSVQEDRCLGDECGCNRLCTRIFRCPGLGWDPAKAKAVVDEVICAGCGVCAKICPAGAIQSQEAAGC
jgi:indolepyruvate ferredoxin oxidoreductase, alpha subunit